MQHWQKNSADSNPVSGFEKIVCTPQPGSRIKKEANFFIFRQTKFFKGKNFLEPSFNFVYIWKLENPPVMSFHIQKCNTKLFFAFQKLLQARKNLCQLKTVACFKSRYFDSYDVASTNRFINYLPVRQPLILTSTKIFVINTFREYRH